MKSLIDIDWPPFGQLVNLSLSASGSLTEPPFAGLFRADKVLCVVSTAGAFVFRRQDHPHPSAVRMILPALNLEATIRSGALPVSTH